MSRLFRRALLERASRPYQSAGRFAWHFSQGKLSGDPIFFALLEHGLIPDATRLIDLGCGRGLLASWLQAARVQYATGMWPEHWPAPPQLQKIWGLDLQVADVNAARAALTDSEISNEHLSFDVGDIRTAELGQADVVLMLDVLHYIDYEAQEDLIRRIRAAMPEGGTLITRIGDAAGGWSFVYSKWVDRIVFFLRGSRQAKLYCRTLDNWIDVLQRQGFSVTQLPMSKGTFFCNVTLVAKAVFN